MKNEILTKYKNLECSKEINHINVIDFEDMPHKLGISPEGYPMFFVLTSENQIPSNNIEREFLSVQFDLPCTLVLDEAEEQKDNKFTIITLKNRDEDLQFSFIEIFTLMLRKLLPNTPKKELNIEIENFITIFSDLSNPPKKKIQGLWAELLVIEQSSNPSTMLASWHPQPNIKYDFSNGRDKIEVKSTSGEERLHRFSLDQLNPSSNSQLFIASVIVRECGKSDTGISIEDLYFKISSKISDNALRLHCYTIIAETLGESLQKSKEVYFDYIEALDSLQYYNYLDVPKIEKETIPPFVSEVKFVSNLSHIIPIDKVKDKDLITASELFKSAL